MQTQLYCIKNFLQFFYIYEPALFISNTDPFHCYFLITWHEYLGSECFFVNYNTFVYVLQNDNMRGWQTISRLGVLKNTNHTAPI